MSRLLKGALVSVEPINPVAGVTVFQYNPENLVRTLRPAAPAETEAGRVEALRLSGPPVETIELTVHVDAADQLERGDELAKSLGVHPKLATLEMLLYPRSAQVIANTVALAVAGTIEVIPPQMPLTLLVWGPKRVVPVRVNGLSVVEEAYDANLNPIRAAVSLELRVLSYHDLPLTHPGYSLFLAHQVAKELMATVGGGLDIATTRPVLTI